MKKRSALLTVLLVLAMAFTACSGGNGEKADDGSAAKEESPEEVSDGKKTLKVATEGSMYPWTFTEDGEIAGYEADIMAEMEKRTGYTIELEAIDWSGIFGALDAGRADTIADIITITDERKEKYVFTQPYVYNPMVLATKSDSDINSMEDIDGKTMVVEVGSSDEIVLEQVQKDFGVKIEPVYYEGISITDVENGRVDLWIGGEPSLNTQINEGEYDLKVVGFTGAYQEYGYPFLKGEEGEALCKEFDDALTAMKEDGTLKAISEKWFKMDITEQKAE